MPRIIYGGSFGVKVSQAIGHLEIAATLLQRAFNMARTTRRLLVG